MSMHMHIHYTRKSLTLASHLLSPSNHSNLNSTPVPWYRSPFDSHLKPSQDLPTPTFSPSPVPSAILFGQKSIRPDQIRS